MTSAAAPRHGGNLGAAERRFGVPPEPWIDLSTGINPHAYPLPELPPDLWQRLPETRHVAALISAAAESFGAPSAPMAVAHGSQALIQILPHLIRPSPVAVLGPTYDEHERAWRNAGHSVAAVDDIDSVYSHTRILVLSNPNNPDGRIIPPDQIEHLAEVMAERGGLVVVDEAFADVAPEISVASLCGRHGLAVLRSFGKFFGLAGMRLGFMLGDDELVAKLRAALGPWPVSGPALAVATKAYQDSAWIADMRIRLNQDRLRLEAVLQAHGMVLVGATDLFVLVRHGQALDIASALGHAGILIREFPARPDLLRFGLPRTEAAWERLAKALDGVGVSSPAST